MTIFLSHKRRYSMKGETDECIDVIGETMVRMARYALSGFAILCVSAIVAASIVIAHL
jgi:hypothetical protein